MNIKSLNNALTQSQEGSTNGNRTTNRFPRHASSNITQFLTCKGSSIPCYGTKLNS